MCDSPSRHPAASSRSTLRPAQREEIERLTAEMRSILGDAPSDALSTARQAEQDREAIADERTFIRRFGFDWPRKDRIALLDLKHRCDLTDREIRLLRWTGSLRREDNVVTVTSSRGIAIFGKCVIVVMFAEFALMVLAGLGLHHPLPALQVAKLYVALVIVIALAWGIDLGYIRPWTIRRRVLSPLAPRLGHAKGT